mgnify:CR=1 FL=1
MKYKKITCFLVTVCLAATLNGFPVIAMENDTAIQGELTDTISYDGCLLYTSPSPRDTR